MSKTTEKNTETDEFTRFQQLTRNLLAVPKKEVERKKAQYEKEKQGKAKRPAK